MGGRGAAFESKGYSSAIKAAEKKIYNDKVETAVLMIVREIRFLPRVAARRIMCSLPQNSLQR